MAGCAAPKTFVPEQADQLHRDVKCFNQNTSDYVHRWSNKYDLKKTHKMKAIHLC